MEISDRQKLALMMVCVLGAGFLIGIMIGKPTSIPTPKDTRGQTETKNMESANVSAAPPEINLTIPNGSGPSISEGNISVNATAPREDCPTVNHFIDILIPANGSW